MISQFRKVERSLPSRFPSQSSRPFSLLAEGAGQPVKALVQPVTRRRTSRLDEPLAVSHVVKAQLLSDLCSRHRIWKVLLVCEDEDHRIPHLILVEHLRKLLLRVLGAVTVVAVNHEDQPLGALVIVAPKGADLVLATNIPDREADVLVFNRLHVEADGWDCCDHFSELELVEDGSLTRSIETHHEDPHLLAAQHALPQLSECETHLAHTLR